MHTPQTILIIGAGTKGRFLASRLSSGADRVVLCDAEAAVAGDAVTEILATHPAAQVEAMQCSYDAAWEADIIVLALPAADHAVVVDSIRPVACRKIVVTTARNRHELESLLPHSAIVDAFAGTLQPDETVHMAGSSRDALDVVARLARNAGLQVGQLTPSSLF
ncbi:MAG: oxidoreductase [Flaviaesturariibacter sp.]|nr:oxidoreductase [Flaviaesturariibacter sp.]